MRGECEISGEVYKKLLKAKQQKETINKNKSDKGEHGDNDDDYTTFGKWNFKGELENEKNKGKVEVARKRLAQVLEEETKKWFSLNYLLKIFKQYIFFYPYT